MKKLAAATFVLILVFLLTRRTDRVRKALERMVAFFSEIWGALVKP